MERADHILSHLKAGEAPGSVTTNKDHVTLPNKFNGWGFEDTQLVVNSKGTVELTGDRYLYSGKEFPSLRPWLEKNASLNIDYTSPSQEHPTLVEPILNENFLNAIKGHYKRLSVNDKERLLHAHGHTAQEMYLLKFGDFERVPDVVVWPESHEQVEAIVKAATEHDVVIIPYGGGTSVTQGLMCPANEKRMIVSVDMRCMNKIKWINKKNMLACIECGIVGRDLEAKLQPHDVVLGHEPDSIEFSTLGGWISTRASGMRKNLYGNIEDIVVHLKVVTPTGTIEKSVQTPRMSAGPDLHHIILGSEGSFGIITEAVVRLRPKPEVTKYGSIIFPNFKQGVDCLYEVALKRAAPVSIRLVDNMQFQFGQALKPASDSTMKDIVDKIKKWYVLNALKYDPDNMCAATLLFEGDADAVAAQEKKLYAIAAKYGGAKAGEENGVRGYFLTYIIAYLRDLGYDYKFIAESFETTVPHSQVHSTCEAVKNRISEACRESGIKYKPFVSCRVTQLYDTAAVIYFYFGFIWEGVENPVAAYEHIEHSARIEIMKNGGTVSHHHGIGKVRSEFLEPTIGKTGVTWLKNIKQAIDPKNIFASGNLVYGEHQ